MLIQALNDYYDVLVQSGKALPDGWTKQDVHYLVSLTGDGVIDEIINCQDKTEVPDKSGKMKEKYVPRSVPLPLNEQTTAIRAYILDYRAAYVFGLNYDKKKGAFTAEDSKENKARAREKHEAFVKENLAFLEGLDSPAIAAYRAFLLNWNPEEETQNPFLLKLGSQYENSKFVFCLSGYPDQMLQDDPNIKAAWDARYASRSGEGQSEAVGRCAVTGETAPIARLHHKIKGVPGGQASGCVLVGYNNASEESYGNEQGSNSQISESVMKRYTESLNYLLKGKKHKIMLSDVTVVFWAMDSGEQCEEMMMAMLQGSSEEMSAEQTEDMLRDLLKDARQGELTAQRLRLDGVLRPDVDFYMAGLKPNNSRLSVKFLYRKRFADMLWNIVRFQQDMQVSEKPRPVALWQVEKELLTPNSKNAVLNPALLSKLLEAMLTGGPYPVALLETAVRRVRTDAELEMSRVRAGLIKACLNRNYQKEEIKVALDKDNHGQAYLCGRLFAVLEKLQEEAAGGNLNRTIKDAYFASASAKPALAFPKLLRLAQNHLSKVKHPGFYNRLIEEITANLQGEFPDTLLLADQGRFMIGYYQQVQDFFTKKEQEEK